MKTDNEIESWQEGQRETDESRKINRQTATSGVKLSLLYCHSVNEFHKEES